MTAVFYHCLGMHAMHLTLDDYMPICIDEQNLVGIEAVLLTVMRYPVQSPLRKTDDASYGSICENLTSSKNRKYRNAARRGPSHGHNQHTEQLAKLGHVVFEICEHTETNRHAHHSTLHPFQGHYISVFRPNRHRMKYGRK